MKKLALAILYFIQQKIQEAWARIGPGIRDAVLFLTSLVLFIAPFAIATTWMDGDLLINHWFMFTLAFIGIMELIGLVVLFVLIILLVMWEVTKTLWNFFYYDLGKLITTNWELAKIRSEIKLTGKYEGILPKCFRKTTAPFNTIAEIQKAIDDGTLKDAEEYYVYWMAKQYKIVQFINWKYMKGSEE